MEKVGAREGWQPSYFLLLTENLTGCGSLLGHGATGARVEDDAETGRWKRMPTPWGTSGDCGREAVWGNVQWPTGVAVMVAQSRCLLLTPGSVLAMRTLKRSTSGMDMEPDPRETSGQSRG